MRLVCFIISILCLFLGACRKRSTAEIEVKVAEIQTADLQNELATLRKEREATIIKLKEQQAVEVTKINDLVGERDRYFEEKKNLDQQVININQELSQNKALNASQRQELQTKLEATDVDLGLLNGKFKKNQEEMATALEKIKLLSEESKKLGDKISELTARIEVLEGQLTAEKAKAILSREPIASTPGAIDGKAPTTVPGNNTPEVKGKLSVQSWQFLQKNVNASESCFDFGGPQGQGVLIARSCVSPSPLRQTFKTEDFTGGFLLINQENQKCLSLDSAAPDLTKAGLVLVTCVRTMEQNQLFQFTQINVDTSEFKIRSNKTMNCLQLAGEKIGQSPCPTASVLRTKP